MSQNYEDSSTFVHRMPKDDFEEIDYISEQDLKSLENILGIEFNWKRQNTIVLDFQINVYNNPRLQLRRFNCVDSIWYISGYGTSKKEYKSSSHNIPFFKDHRSHLQVRVTETELSSIPCSSINGPKENVEDWLKKPLPPFLNQSETYSISCFKWEREKRKYSLGLLIACLDTMDYQAYSKLKLTSSNN